MAQIWRGREGTITAADTATALQTWGSDSASKDLIVPPGVQRITQVLISAASDSAAVGAASVLVNLSGDAISGSPQQFAGPSYGGQLATGSQAATQPVPIHVDIPVIAGGTLKFSAEMTNADVGSVAVAVSVCFE